MNTDISAWGCYLSVGIGTQQTEWDSGATKQLGMCAQFWTVLHDLLHTHLSARGMRLLVAIDVWHGTKRNPELINRGLSHFRGLVLFWGPPPNNHQVNQRRVTIAADPLKEKNKVALLPFDTTFLGKPAISHPTWKKTWTPPKGGLGEVSPLSSPNIGQCWKRTGSPKRRPID